MRPLEAFSQSYGQLILDALETATTLVPLKALRPAFLDDLFTHVTIQTVFTGEVLFEDGAIDRQHIYLQNGIVRYEYPNGRKEVVSAHELFAPLAHQQPRPCRCVAKTDCTILRIDSDRVDRTLSWSQISDYLLSELALERQYDDDFDWMQTVLNSNLFLKVPPVNVEQIFPRLTPMVVKKGEVIIQQGDSGDCCYFLKQGEASVIVTRGGLKQTELLATIGPGRCFGEDALVNKTVRNATVTMMGDGLLMRLEKSDFQLLLELPAVDEAARDDIREMVEDPIYVDVRTEDEYAEGHLAFSANIPLALLSLKKRLIAQEKPHIFYCDTGRRSAAAAYLLGKQGYNVMSLQGGIAGQELAPQLVAGENYILRDGELVSGQ